MHCFHTSSEWKKKRGLRIVGTQVENVTNRTIEKVYSKAGSPFPQHYWEGKIKILSDFFGR